MRDIPGFDTAAAAPAADDPAAATPATAPVASVPTPAAALDVMSEDALAALLAEKLAGIGGLGNTRGGGHS